jgi:CheY-like chemotaxis protein
MTASSCTLLVDDDTTNFLNQALLRRINVTDTVLVTGNGQEALNLLRAHCASAASPTYPALILLAMKMLLMNGFQFLQAYRRTSTCVVSEEAPDPSQCLPNFSKPGHSVVFAVEKAVGER